MATKASIPITNTPEANQLLVDEPLALLLGMLLDQQVPMEWAFLGPFTLKERLGDRDPFGLGSKDQFLVRKGGHDFV